MSYATLTTKKYLKNPNTKTTWIHQETIIEKIDEKKYFNITNKNTVKFFRSLGGSEHVVKAYTKNGYIPIEIYSKSPCRTKKTVREFKFL